MRLSAIKIRKIYNNIKYKATDGKIYFLKEYYPFCIPIKNSKYSILLDTGGQMTTCDFFEGEIKDAKLFRKDVRTNKWNKIADLVKSSLI